MKRKLCKFLCMVVVALGGAAGGHLRAQIETRHAFAVGDATVLIGREGVALLDSAAAAPRVVWSAHAIEEAVQTPGGFVVAGEEKLSVIARDSWQARTGEIGGSIRALASAAEATLAFGAGGRVWRLQPGGEWKVQGAIVDGVVMAATNRRGVWVAVGNAPPSETAPREEGAATLDASPPGLIWWSADGANWRPATLPGSAEDGPFPILTAVAGGAAGFVAMAEIGAVLVSADGQKWSIAENPPPIEPRNTYRLTVAGGVFYLAGSGYSPHDELHRSTDGRAWETVPLADGASREAIFVRGGEAWAVGRRFPFRPIEAAPVARFAEVFRPPARAVTIAGAELPPGAELSGITILNDTGEIAPAALGLTAMRRESGRRFVAGKFGGAMAGEAGILRVDGRLGPAPLDALSAGAGWAALRGDELVVRRGYGGGDAQTIKAPPAGVLNAAASTKTQVVAVGAGDLIVLWQEPQNLSVWIWRGGGDSGDLVAVAADGKRFVAVGARRPSGATAPLVGGAVIEGEARTPLKNAIGDIAGVLRGVAFDGAEFVAVGAGGLVFTSADTKRWTRFNVERAPDFTHAAAAGGRAYACDREGTIYARVRPDAWQVVARAPKTAWAGLFDDGGRLAAFTADGTVLRLPAAFTPLPGSAPIAAIDPVKQAAARAEAERLAATKKAEAEKAGAERTRAREFERLLPDFGRDQVVLSNVTKLEKFVREHGEINAAEATKLVAAVLKTRRRPAEWFLYSVTGGVPLASAFHAALSPAEREAMRTFANETGGRLPGRLRQVPTLAALGTPWASTAMFDVAAVERRSGYMGTADKQSYVGAAFDMALARMQGWGVPKDEAKAREHMRLAQRDSIGYMPPPGAAGHDAPLHAGVNIHTASGYGSAVGALLLGEWHRKANREADAMRAFRLSAQRSGYDAAVHLAFQLFYEGDVRGATTEEAYGWLLAAARKGHVESIAVIGLGIFGGCGLERDTALGREWLQAAAKLGSKLATDVLADLDRQAREFAATIAIMNQASEVEAKAAQGLAEALKNYNESLKAAQEKAGIDLAPKAPTGPK